MLRLIRTLIAFVSGLFRRKLSFPHPEEPKDPLATAENTVLAALLEKWFNGWDVPGEHHDFWRNWPKVLVPSLSYMGNPYPALTWPDRTEIDPKWANPGIIAHESCHVVWPELQEDERTLFGSTYRLASETYPLVALVKAKMLGKDPAWANSPAEIHADCYRYLGQSLPQILKPYYPRLL